MTAAFRNGDYGPGLVQGTTAVIGRIAEGRGIPAHRSAPT